MSHKTSFHNETSNNFIFHNILIHFFIVIWCPPLPLLLEVENELGRLYEAREAVDCACEARLLPLQGALNCLATRERRRQHDLVTDQVEVRLSDSHLLKALHLHMM